MHDFLWQAFITLLVIVDPFMVVPVFIGLTKGDSAEQRQNTAKKSCVIAAILLLFFGLAGDKLLNALGISQPAFRIAGGFLLLLAGIEMVMAHPSGLRSPNTAEEKEAIHKDDISVFPLAIPLIAGPGSMTSIVVLMREAEAISFITQCGVMALGIIVIIITYVTMRLGAKLMKLLGVTGMNVLTRVFGVIVAALATEHIVSGVSSVFKQIIAH
jgi:multiple antibiotic resistance protein